MKLYESSEDYLEAILILSKQLEEVHAVDVARHLNFSKASVSVALHKLEEGGYLVFNEHGGLVLTEKGLEIANNIYERHVVLSELFMSMGVSKEQALEDACKVEHDISEETFEAIKKAFRN